MQSAEPTPNNPWPRDMVLHVQFDEHLLLELLWVRESWRLKVTGPNVPPRPIDLDDPELTAEGLRRDKAVWERAWIELWEAALAGLTRRRNPGATDAMPASVVDALSDEQVRALWDGDSWRSRFGDDAFTPGYRAWVDGLQARRDRLQEQPLGMHAERQVLDELVPAWRRGLTTMITVPCMGTYTRTLGDDTLLLTESAHDDVDQLRAALRQFRP